MGLPTSAPWAAPFVAFEAARFRRSVAAAAGNQGTRKARAFGGQRARDARLF